MLGCNRSSVYRMDRLKLPYIETAGGPTRGGRRRYAMSDVRALAEARESDLADRVSRLEERVDRLEQA
jgi:hypothetical protein